MRELDAESVLKRFWKYLSVRDEERTVSRGANNPQEQVADKS